MEASQILHNLDSLWFFTNIFTHNNDQDPLPSLTPSSTPKCYSNTAHDSPIIMNNNVQEEGDKNVEAVNVPCELDTAEVKNKGGEGRRKRRKKRKRSERHGSRKINGDEMGFDKNVPRNRTFKLNNPTSWTLPYHDDMAMKEHLKSWAYAVACIVK